MGAERSAVLDDSEFFEHGLKSARADFSTSLADNFLIMFAEAGEARLVPSRERERHKDHEASAPSTRQKLAAVPLQRIQRMPLRQGSLSFENSCVSSI